MLDAAIKALSQILSPPFRAILVKSIGLALVLLLIGGITIHRGLIWLAASGEAWAENVLGPAAHTPLAIFDWIVSVAAGLGLIVGSVLLMPAVTAVVGSFLVDDIALEVERAHYPRQPVGSPLPFMRAMLEGARTALLALVVYLLAVPSLLIAGAGVVIFFVASACLLGREYFELAAMRYHPVRLAKRLRKENQRVVFVAGLLIAAFVSIPIVNLATPLFAMALMVHIHKRVMATAAPSAGGS